MDKTFAGQLKSFAYAVDFVDDESYIDIRDIVLDYTHRVLDIDFTRQLILAESDGEEALMPYGLSTEGTFTSVKMRGHDNAIKTQAAYSFINDCSLWIVSDESENHNLGDTEKHKDLWGQETNHAHNIIPNTDNSLENITIYDYWDKKDRVDLEALNELLIKKNLTIERYVRVASTSSSLKLMTHDFNIYLSTLLNLKTIQSADLGLDEEAETLSAFKRIVLEIVDNEIPAGMIKGIEPMLAGSPMSKLVTKAQRKKNIKMLVVGGNQVKPGTLSRGIKPESDLVTDNQAVCSGLAQNDETHCFIHSSEKISHFLYFKEEATRSSVVSWLTEKKPENNNSFDLLTKKVHYHITRTSADNFDPSANTLPIVFIIPDFLTTHLAVQDTPSKQSRRIWLDFDTLSREGLNKLKLNNKNVILDGLINEYYGDLASHMEKSHSVIQFGYDWRKPMSVSSEELYKEIVGAIKGREKDTPIRILAHGMGGLVVRTLFAEQTAEQASKLNEIFKREGSRIVMLGTPNQGTHSIVDTLLCKSETIRKISTLASYPDIQKVAGIFARYPGVLQLLPRPGFFEETAISYVSNDQMDNKDQIDNIVDEYRKDWFGHKVWTQFKKINTDRWLGDKKCGVHTRTNLTDAKTHWELIRNKENSILKSIDVERVCYICGKADLTPCGVIEENTEKGKQLKFLKTSEGDGLVTWESGKLEGLPENRYWYMPVDHASLTSTNEYFSAIQDLLETGKTAALKQNLTATKKSSVTTSRSLRVKVIAKDADPTSYPGRKDIYYSLMGSKQRLNINTEALKSLEVSVRAMDLRDAQYPLIGGHYSADPLAGAEALIDKYLVDGALTLRERIGNYASEVGSSTIVIRNQNKHELERGTGKGTIIVGLGEWGKINVPSITETVYEGVLRYLLEHQERHPFDEDKQSLKLHSLLIGQNSTNHISIDSSVDAIVLGICKANRKLESVLVNNKGLHVGKLEFIEYYHDTAISAAHAVSTLNDRVRTDVNSMSIHLKPHTLLKVKGAPRYRLSVKPSLNYWPRMMVTTADDDQDSCTPECYEKLKNNLLQESCGEGVDTPECYEKLKKLLLQEPCGEGVDSGSALRAVTGYGIAESLKFVMLSERARAEAKLHQRQIGLVEGLISKVIMDKSYDPNLSRTLFQLIVPLEFKTSLRLGHNLLLVLDGYTANLPWEMLQADDKPLILKTSMVRQFVSMRYRHVVNSSDCKFACVIGNPSTAGFYDNFYVKGTPEEEDGGLISLAGARDEADIIKQILSANDYDVESLYPPKHSPESRNSAIEVFNGLFKNPYRIVAIAAHGIVNAENKYGKKVTGVVLSDGAMLTAAEMSQMEAVPELVFLNCCYLGTMDNQPVESTANYNYLAYSLSRELIEMGVRCVVAAGWAVDDQAAYTFSKVFFDEFVSNKRTFGSSIWRARKKVFEEHTNTNTWGAYQAYGDPTYVLEPNHDHKDESQDYGFVSPDEVIKQLNHIFEGIKHSKHLSFNDLESKVDNLVGSIPASWAEKPEVQFVVGKVFGEIEPRGFERAMKAYQHVIVQEDSLGMVPVKAIEQLANIEARLGEKKGKEEGLALIDRSINRLISLDKTTSLYGDQSVQVSNVERYALLGSAYKRKAAVLLGMGKVGCWQEIVKALKASRKAYCKGENLNQSLGANIYPILNRLQYDALLLITGNGDIDDNKVTTIDKEANLTLARQCQEVAKEKLKHSYDFFDSVMISDAELTMLLTDSNEVSIKEKTPDIIKSYKNSMKSVSGSPREVSSVINQLRLLVEFLSIYNHDEVKKYTELLSKVSEELEKEFMRT